jgi:serine/threonine protein phosphatase 1
MKINIIGDIAGRFDEFQKLLAKMPEADLILSVGDMIDRGPQSKQVIQWFMRHQKLGKAEAIYGNHEDMMIDSNRFSGYQDWMYNGGSATLRSYLKKGQTDLSSAKIPESHLSWLKKRPLYFQTDDLFVSHAPITSLEYVPDDPYSRDHYFIWNRYVPYVPQSKFMVYGHNGTLREHIDNNTLFAICIDNSHKGELCGLHWPTKEVFRQKFREVEEFEALSPEEQQKILEEAKKKQEERNKALSLLGW